MPDLFALFFRYNKRCVDSIKHNLNYLDKLSLLTVSCFHTQNRFFNMWSFAVGWSLLYSGQVSHCETQ